MKIVNCLVDMEGKKKDMNKIVSSKKLLNIQI